MFDHSKARRRSVAIAVAVMVAVLGGACGDDDDSEAGPTPTASQPGTSSTEPPPQEPADLDLTGLVPCSALTVEDLTALGLDIEPDRQDADADGSFCGWTQGPKRVLVALFAGDAGKLAQVEASPRP